MNFLDIVTHPYFALSVIGFVVMGAVGWWIMGKIEETEWWNGE